MGFSLSSAQYYKAMPTLLLLGADSDISRCCAQQFGAAGFNLLLTSRRSINPIPEWAEAIKTKHGVQVQLLSFDANDLHTHEVFYEALPVLPEVVISAIGYLGDEDLARGEQTERVHIMTSNFVGLVSLLDRLAQAMQERASGHILGISSVAGERGRASNYHYGASKAGFTAYLSGLRQYLRPHGVHVGTIKPGFVRTKMLGDRPTPDFLTASPMQVARATFKAYQKRLSVVYCLPAWRPIMWIIRHIPEAIFQRLSL